MTTLVIVTGILSDTVSWFENIVSCQRGVVCVLLLLLLDLDKVMCSTVRRQCSVRLDHTEVLKENSLCSFHMKPRGGLLFTGALIVSLSK